MATPKLIERVLELRQAARLRERRPARLFETRLRRPRQVLSLVEKHADSEELRHEARRQYIVTLATAFEVYWREFFSFSLDQYRAPHASVSHLTKVSVTLADVGAIIGRKLTLGELISCAYSFQGVEALNAAASAVIEMDAFALFRKSNFRIDVVRKKGDEKPHPKPITQTGVDVLTSALPQVKRCFTIRNEVVHNIGRRVQPSLKELFEIEGCMSTFNVFFSLFLQGQFDTRFEDVDA